MRGRRVLETSLYAALIAAAAGFLSAAQGASPIDQGIAEFNAGHFDKAIALFGEAEPTNFNNAVFHYYFGSALVRTNHNADAIKQFKLALVLEPTGKVSEYCKKALVNLGEKPGTDGAKPGAAADKTTSGQTPQVFAVVCGCSLCARVEVLLGDIEKRYGKTVVVTRCPTASRFGSTPVCADAKYQGILTHYQVSKCPTLLFFGKQGELAGQMNGVIADADVWRQLNALTDKPESPEVTRAAARTQAARDSIMQDAAAKIADTNRLEQEELSRLQKRADQDMADIPFRRRNWIDTGLIQQDLQKRQEQVKADFERRRKAITDEANTRADGLNK